MAHEQSRLSGTGDGDSRSAEEIRRDIERTRAEMDRTVDAIGDRLRPRHLLDDVVDLFRSRSGIDSASLSDAGRAAQDYGYKLLDKLKQHPVPAALIGAGLTWLLFEGDHPSPAYSSRNAGVSREKLTAPGMYSGSYVDARTGLPYDESYGQGARQSGESLAGFTLGQGEVSANHLRHQAGQVGESIADKASGAAESVKDAARSVKESITDTARNATEKVSEWAGSARDAAGSASHRAGDGASYAADQFQRGYASARQTFLRALDEYPLAMGAAALAAGVLAGLCLPGTRREDQLMGEASDQLKEQVKSTGEELLERGKQVATATASAAADEANRQGLNPGELGRRVKGFAGHVAEAARDAAQEEGLNPDDLGERVHRVAERAKDAASDEAREQTREMRA